MSSGKSIIFEIKHNESMTDLHIAFAMGYIQKHILNFNVHSHEYSCIEFSFLRRKKELKLCKGFEIVMEDFSITGCFCFSAVKLIV